MARRKAGIYWFTVRLPPTPRAPRLGRSQLVVCFYGLLSCAAIGWSCLRGHPNILLSPNALLTPHRVGHYLSSLVIGVACGLLIVMATRVMQERFSWARVLHNEFHHLLGALRPREILLLAAASSIGEECFFRGALLSHLAQALPGVLGIAFGVIGSSLLFGLLHIGPGAQFLPWTLSSLGVGVLLGTIYISTGDLLGPIATHFVVNFLNLQDIVRRQMPA